jgi:glucose/arabinose dehydrogenase
LEEPESNVLPGACLACAKFGMWSLIINPKGISQSIECVPVDPARFRPHHYLMRLLAIAIVLVSQLAFGACAAKSELSQISLPPGFSIELFAQVPNARQMAMGESTLFIGTRRGTEVYAIELLDGNTRAGTRHTITSGRTMPNGVAFRDGSLYVAEVSRILRFDNIEERLADPPEPVVLPAEFPSDQSHGWKYIAFGPDGLLYVPVGAPCNICDAGDPYAAIWRMNPDGTGMEIFARSVRNTVGFAWQPETDIMFFTDNGRDWLGDNEPPDELNQAPHQGLHFGYPYCHGGYLLDPEFGSGRDCADYVAPTRNLGPHVAALGMKFYGGDQFPADYKGDILIAEHGSWNRSVPIGYRVMRVSLDGPDAPTYEVFAQGWLNQDGSRWGRPVDVLELPDGSILVSDDLAGAIYRIRYGG